MVEIIKAERGPLIHIHHIARDIHGNGIAVRVYGEMKIAAKEYIYAHELGLKTIEVLNLTPEAGNHTAYIATNWIYHKGEYGNYASVDIFDNDGTEITAGRGPSDGSVWLNFVAVGE